MKIKHRIFIASIILALIWVLISLGISFATKFIYNGVEMWTIQLPLILSNKILTYVIYSLKVLNVDVLSLLQGATVVQDIILSAIFLAILPFTVASIISYAIIRVFLMLKS